MIGISIMHNKSMTKSNVQVRIPPEMESQISRLTPRSKSAFVREAIEEKIRRETFRRLEQDWIRALSKKPEDTRPVKDWLKAESWGDK